jgi:hypothetical protein
MTVPGFGAVGPVVHAGCELAAVVVADASAAVRVAAVSADPATATAAAVTVSQ